MPWTLRFPYDTVDARVFVRQSISEMRRDPAVTDARLVPNLPRSAWFDTVQVQIEFLEGHDQPSDSNLTERMQVFLPRREPPTPWPYDPPVPDEDEDEQPPRQRGMTLNFERLYGPLDRPNENGDHFTPELRQQLIQQYLGNAEGRQRLAAPFANPIRRNLDYQSIARRTFLVEQIPDGALPVYDRDPNVADIVTAHAEPRITPDFVVPDWIQPGIFARFIGPDDMGRPMGGRVVEVEQVLRPEDPPGRNGPPYVRVWAWSRAGTWSKDTDPSANDVILAESFARLWEPCDKPSDPKTAWDRLGSDEPF